MRSAAPPRPRRADPRVRLFAGAAGLERGRDAIPVRAGRQDLPGGLSSSSSVPPASLRLVPQPLPPPPTSSQPRLPLGSRQ
ncbi:unnamed protein product [Rangifer tarandus platyrhynchus]|uniref:Uncharacterized protein n=1 Tax=Rangifer tarandus platyrhynchus TaxID=3082113 RepID=A0ABN8YTT3_RANTA|nr:unnamed protein product [Rangifer tarandus platyrhynchus]